MSVGTDEAHKHSKHANAQSRNNDHPKHNTQRQVLLCTNELTPLLQPFGKFLDITAINYWVHSRRKLSYIPNNVCAANCCSDRSFHLRLLVDTSSTVSLLYSFSPIFSRLKWSGTREVALQAARSYLPSIPFCHAPHNRRCLTATVLLRRQQTRFR